MANGDKLKNACETLLGKKLPGERRGGAWTITQCVERLPNATGGTFSVGYLATHEDGTEAFVKATDIGLLTRNSSESPLTKMRQALSEQDFEREILEVCRGNNLDRIVHALDHGQLETTENGVRDIVFYIMFEKAAGDVRRQINTERRAGLGWSLHALHNLATAIQQLHRQRIAHNDVKPSNFLFFDEELQKLADLGRATSEDNSGPWDKVRYSGDTNYAAPEFCYNGVNFAMDKGKISFSVRQASDLYHLGSMAFFLVTGQKITPLLRTFLRPEHNPHNWRGSFAEVLPFLRDATGECMALLDAELPRNEADELCPEAIAFRAAIFQLCDPDPQHRGNPLNILNGVDKYALDRYISMFSSHSKTLRIRERNA